MPEKTPIRFVGTVRAVIKQVNAALNEIWANLVSYHEETVTLGGDFDSKMQIKCTKVGDVVTISGVGVLTHSSGSLPTSAAGVVPEKFRPSDTTSNIFAADTVIRSMIILASGAVIVAYSDFSGAGSSMTTTQRIPSITYNL